MALIKCSECGNMVSDKASECPHCGAPVEIKTEENPIICEECGQVVPDNATECPECGCPIHSEEMVEEDFSEGTTIICEECGQVALDNADECPNCGCPISKETNTTIEDSNPTLQVKNKSTRYLLIASIGALFVIAVGVKSYIKHTETQERLIAEQAERTRLQEEAIRKEKARQAEEEERKLAEKRKAAEEERRREEERCRQEQEEANIKSWIKGSWVFSNSLGTFSADISDDWLVVTISGERIYSGTYSIEDNKIIYDRKSSGWTNYFLIDKEKKKIYDEDGIYLQKVSSTSNTGKSSSYSGSSSSSTSRNKNNSRFYGFNSPTSVISWLCESPFYSGSTSISFTFQGMYLNGNCVSGAPVVLNYSTNYATVRVSAVPSTTVTFRVYPENGKIIDGAGYEYSRR